MDVQRLGKMRSAGGGEGLRARAVLVLRGVCLWVALIASMFGLPGGVQSADAQKTVQGCSLTYTGGEELFFNEVVVSRESAGGELHESENKELLTHYVYHLVQCEVEFEERGGVGYECTPHGGAVCAEGWSWMGKEVPGTHRFLRTQRTGINVSEVETMIHGLEWPYCGTGCGVEAKEWGARPKRLRRRGRRRSERFGTRNEAEPNFNEPCEGDPVSCATGNLTESETDLSVGGRGVPLNLVRTYNSQAAVEASSPRMFGYGWSSSFSDHLEINSRERS